MIPPLGFLNLDGSGPTACGTGRGRRGTGNGIMTPAQGSGQARAAAGARPRLREPGLAGFTPGTERYRVAGGASLVVALQPGDRLTVTDIEGRQPCELVAFDAQGPSREH